jgi:hypothetical protein
MLGMPAAGVRPTIAAGIFCLIDPGILMARAHGYC